MSITEPDLSANNARVYLGRELDDIPPHPGDEWTRFVCISDTHSMIIPVPAGDVLIHAGDIGWGRLSDIKRMFEWLKTLPHEKKVVIAGNHDLCLDADWQEGGKLGVMGFSENDFQTARDFVRSPEVLEAGICYLEHERLELALTNRRMWKIYGSPAAPRYALGSFQYGTDEEAEAIYSRVPTDTDVLLTHTPPYGTLDTTHKGKHAGCQILAARLQELRSCRLHVYGHIHEAQGAEIGEGNRVSVNAATAGHGVGVVVDLHK